MNNAGELTVTDSFNGLLSRMAALDHTAILKTGRKILKQAKKDRMETTMRMSELIQMTGVTKEDLEFFISCRLIAVRESAGDPVLSFSGVYALVRIFSRFAGEGVISWEPALPVR